MSILKALHSWKAPFVTCISISSRKRLKDVRGNNASIFYSCFGMQMLTNGLVRHRSLALDWLSNVDFRSNYQDALRRREAGTGQWLIDQELFKSWRDGPVQALWLHGMRTYIITLPFEAEMLSNINEAALLTNSSWSR
jgi:hypothetical protein